jgi:hypothetical protein
VGVVAGVVVAVRMGGVGVVVRIWSGGASRWWVCGVSVLVWMVPFVALTATESDLRGGFWGDGTGGGSCWGGWGGDRGHGWAPSAVAVVGGWLPSVWMVLPGSMIRALPKMIIR